MQHANLISQTQRAIRSTICPHCWIRPVGSETLGPMTPRTCEPGCTIFLNIPRLLGIAKHDASQPFIYEKHIKNIICSQCNATPTAGDFCEQEMTRTCPLSRYSGELLPVVEAVLREYMKTNRPAEAVKGAQTK